MMISGLDTFTYVMADHPPSSWLHIVCYRPMCRFSSGPVVSLWPGWIVQLNHISLPWRTHCMPPNDKIFRIPLGMYQGVLLHYSMFRPATRIRSTNPHGFQRPIISFIGGASFIKIHLCKINQHETRLKTVYFRLNSESTLILKLNIAKELYGSAAPGASPLIRRLILSPFLTWRVHASDPPEPFE